jgi:hypothetical protein
MNDYVDRMFDEGQNPQKEIDRSESNDGNEIAIGKRVHDAQSPILSDSASKKANLFESCSPSPPPRKSQAVAPDAMPPKPTHSSIRKSSAGFWYITMKFL